MLKSRMFGFGPGGDTGRDSVDSTADGPCQTAIENTRDSAFSSDAAEDGSPSGSPVTSGDLTPEPIDLRPIRGPDDLGEDSNPTGGLPGSNEATLTSAAAAAALFGTISTPAADPQGTAGDTLAVTDEPVTLRSEAVSSAPASLNRNQRPRAYKHAIRLVPCIDHSASAPWSYAKPIQRRIKGDAIIRVGRVESRSPNSVDVEPIVFRSKVVSRTHAELILENGKWYIQDVQSSSGTFLNNTRLSLANQTSAKCALENGDILQLGLNFRGGVEEVFQCVKVRVELDYSWDRRDSEYNVESMRKLREQFGALKADSVLRQCSICLMDLQPSQPMFISPCSHAWHYKCIRPLLVRTYPRFQCTDCRGAFDLEQDDEDETDEELGEDDQHAT